MQGPGSITAWLTVRNAMGWHVPGRKRDKGSESHRMHLWRDNPVRSDPKRGKIMEKEIKKTALHGWHILHFRSVDGYDDRG